MADELTPMREPSADCDPLWHDDPDIQPVDPRTHDLRGQGLTAVQLHDITDMTITGEYV